MRKFFTAVFLLFLAFAYGTVTGHDVFCSAAQAKTAKPRPGNAGPDDTDDGSGGGSGGGPDDTDDGSGGGSGGGSDPDGSGGGADF